MGGPEAKGHDAAAALHDERGRLKRQPDPGWCVDSRERDDLEERIDLALMVRFLFLRPCSAPYAAWSHANIRG
jgi:hypothetical protein